MASRESAVLLMGEPAQRPAGLERELGRAGFRVTDESAPGDGAHEALAAVVMVPAGTVDVHALISETIQRAGRNVPLIALLPVADHGLVVQALAAGAADALLPPVHLGELTERLAARIRERRHGAEGQVAGAMAPLLAQAAGVLRTDELLRVVSSRLVHALDLARVEVLLVHGHEGYARRVGMVPGEALADQRLELSAWPGLGEAAGAEGPVFVSPPMRSAPRPLEEASRALAVRAARGASDSVLFLMVPRAGRELSPAQVAFAQEVVTGLGASLDEATPQGALSPRADPLTGLDLGRAFELRVQVELERARRYALGFAIVMLDVDGLAAFNDAQGAERGDELLQRIARLLAREVRLPDAVARLGGDEFGLLLPETGLEGAETAVRRIRLRLEDAKQGGGQLPNVSVGVVTLPYPDVHYPDEALALAEAALLRAKSVKSDA